MKSLKYILIIVIVGIGLFFILKPKNTTAPPVVVDTTKKPIELCFGKFGKPNERGFYDVDTLRMTLDGEKATGELKLLPAEKDSKVGKFKGTVSAVDKIMMGRRMELWWDTLAEGMNTTEELKINFGEGTASIGFGEMINRGDGVYVYKDPANIHYTLDLTDISCTDLNEHENVESYLRKNISTLSPTKAVLGGMWYVVSYTVDVANNSGNVVYEDGHIQEKKSFSYTTDDKGQVIALTIK